MSTHTDAPRVGEDQTASAQADASYEGRRLSVLIVSESSLEQTNGVSGSVKRILDRFAERGFDARVIAPQPAPEGGTYDGFPVTEEPSWPIQNFNVAICTKTPVIQEIKNGPKPDIIHIAAPISKLGHAALIAGEELGVPTVAIYQTDVAQYARRFARQTIDGVDPRPTPHHNGWLRRIGEAAGDKAEQIVADRIAQMHNLSTLTLAPTDQARQRLESFGVDPKLIRIWGRGVDSTLFTPERRSTPNVQELHRQWSHDGTVPVVGYVGRLAPEKQVDRLAVLADLDVQLVVVGGGPCEAELHEQLPNAVFTGMLHGDDLADAYAALDIFTHTGAEETFGQTIQEAMASGLPVIAPDSGGPIDLVRQGESGLLFDPQDDADLHRCVETLVTDDSLRKRMGTAGHRIVQARTWPAMVDRLIDYYRLAIEINLAHSVSR
ncbi:glycosyltransferase [Bifidobacterium margollesii]|uniref:Glycosyltransferase n=1 Tax=Bifidobacterium margollesii TaxID=2020964 RepID=A0A2N5JB41_9BIFI|nr:glycosyltransferase family 1 protein [Bifidobacterium margollesii]PLS31428.1 glycosyltransferase [Bifidobacterium margollesii]